jgi:prepilin-type N-terminal cleavage/methylation domain-containing protein
MKLQSLDRCCRAAAWIKDSFAPLLSTVCLSGGQKHLSAFGFIQSCRNGTDGASFDCRLRFSLINMPIGPTDNRSRNCRVPVAGYTLVEVMVAVALLGLVMVILFGGIGQGYLNLNTTRQDLRATQILTHKTEAVRLCTWTNLAELPTTFVDYYLDSPTNNSGMVTYYGTISVTDATNIPSTVSYYDQIKMITISVTWTNNLYDHTYVHTRSMQTLASRDGLVNYIYGFTP